MNQPKIRSFPCNGETHYAVFDGNGRIVAYCNYERSAKLVCDDIRGRAPLVEQP